MHVTHDCPTARAVWAAVADTWEAATTEPLDITDPTLTVLGLRPQPPVDALGGDRARYYAREPAWRLLHAVTLLKLHQARTRAHMAYNDPKGPREPRQSKPRHILRAIRQRCAHTGSATSTPKPCTPRVLSPSLARDEARGTLFTSTGSPPASPPWPRAGALACTCSPQPRRSPRRHPAPPTFVWA